MTGFGSAEGQVQGGRLSLEIRTVNHRYYNPQLKLPLELGGIEGQLRERLRQLLDRGHVTVSARWLEPASGVASGAVTVDLARAREGQALVTELARRLDALEAGAREVERRAPERLATELARLKKAVAELAGGVQVDEQRLAVEIALMADRVDVTEELVRLRAHLAACREGLAKDGAVGKQLGFLSQELLREANTIGSKANDAAITQTVIAMKGELEKFREQLENLE